MLSLSTAIVVSGGEVCPLISMSSKPITDRSSGTRSLRLRLETDVYYPLFVQRVLAECRSGAKPVASLRDAEAMMQVMDAAYASARQGGVPQTLGPIPE